MPTATHYQLAQIPGTEFLWDPNIVAFNESIADAPADRTVLGAFADWCDDHGEPELADAARYLSKRAEVRLGVGNGGGGRWFLTGLPAAVAQIQYPDRNSDRTPLGVLACLYYRLTAARKELE